MSDDPARLNSEGLKALAAGDGARAAALLARAVDADPGAAILWYNLANAHAAAGDTAAQGEALDSALERDPYMAHALLAKGALLEAQGDMRGALDHYRRLLAAVDPREPVGPSFAAGLSHARAALTRADAAVAARIDEATAARLAAAPPSVAERFAHAVDVQFGRRQVYTHQPLVLHYPYLPAIQFFDRALFPWLDRLEAATPAIRAELAALLTAGDAGFAPYVAYPRGAPVNQWAALNHSDAWAAQFLIQHGEANAVMQGRCPQTAALLETLPLFDLAGRGPTAFFSLLKPGAHIPPHTGATNIRTIIHLPLIVPPGCTFRVGNDTRPWVEGQAWAFDDTIEHEARNASGQLRALLILDVWNPFIAPEERDLLRDYIAALDRSGNGLGAFRAD